MSRTALQVIGAGPYGLAVAAYARRLGVECRIVGESMEFWSGGAMRQMHLAGFLIAGPIAHSHALWRHPRTEFDFLRPEGYSSIAGTLELGKFDMVFFADRLAVSSTRSTSHLARCRFRGCRACSPRAGLSARARV